MNFIYFCFFLSIALADFSISNTLGSHMVLQRAPNRASIYGSCDVDDEIVVELKRMNYTALVDENGLWRALLPPTEADDIPYTIYVYSRKTNTMISLEDVLFGDVWFCSGQSNMEMKIYECFNPEKEYEEASLYPNLRLFTLAHNEQDDHEVNDIASNQVVLHWTHPTPEALGKNQTTYIFSAVCWHYGKSLYNKLHIPQGLVVSSVGGTMVEAWSPNEVYTEECPNDGYDKKSSMNINEIESLQDPNKHWSSLWNGMVYPFLRMTIKGVLWYQGEANRVNPGNKLEKSGYACRFPAMIRSWRKYFSQIEGTTSSTFPFGFVSLSGWCLSGACQPLKETPTTIYGGAVLRWSQQAEHIFVPNNDLENVFVAMSYDLEDSNVPIVKKGVIHPRDKESVGQRLALSALHEVYHYNNTYTGPILNGCSINNNTLTIEFDNSLLNGEFIAIKQTFGYDIQIKHKEWYPVSILNVPTSSSILLNIDSIQDTITGLRYAWRWNPCCPLVSTDTPYVKCIERSCAVYTSNSDLPAVPFTVSIENNKCVLPS
ncbi:hypothetical protein WA158_007068 [Blastocystis sp. Blastoise]